MEGEEFLNPLSLALFFRWSTVGLNRSGRSPYRE